MSLGFLTESALLPSKSKPIQVDSRSQIPLKAIVAEELLKKEAKESLRGSRGKKRAIEEKRKDVYAGKNKGIEQRMKQDQVIQNKEDERDKREFTYMAVLRKKAEEYERLAKGERDPDSDDEDCLVDFSKKPRYTDKSASPSRQERDGSGSSSSRKPSGVVATDDWGDLGAGEAEITDEFGRTRRVSKKSELYKQYKEEHQAQRRHEAFFGRSTSGQHGESGRGATNDHEEEEEEQQQGAWSWSRGEDSGREKRKKKRREREEEPELPKTSADGSILTQWDRKLHSQAREYLQEVITEESSRTGEAADIYEQKQREKEERRAKLKLKIQSAAKS